MFFKTFNKENLSKNKYIDKNILLLEKLKDGIRNDIDTSIFFLLYIRLFTK